MLECRWIEVDDAYWLEALSRCRHDIYHLPEYARLEAKWVGAKAMAFVARDKESLMLLPLLVREIPESDKFDAVTPYGYSPPVFSSDAPDCFIEQALSAFNDLAREKGLISTFMRLHPMLSNSMQIPLGLSRWTLVKRGQTVSMPLEEDGESWERSLIKGHRYDLRRLRRDGCEIEFNTDLAWATFPDVYRQTMERIGASPAYFYSNEYLHGFREAFQDKSLCGLVRDSDGQAMCAAIFTHVEGMVQYHLSGTVAEFSNRAPTKILLASVREWCRSSNVRSFHLGGGFGGGSDTLFNFKRRFGGKVLPFRTISAIHDGLAFDKLCMKWSEKSGRELPGPEGFFPPYRAPLRAAA